MNLTLILSIVGAIIVLGALIASMYMKANPQIAFIISGIKKNPRVLIGTGGIKIPIFERMDKLFLGQISVDVKTQSPVPTHNYIDVNVDAVCKVQVDPDNIQLAAKNFLNMSPQTIAAEIKDSLEGNMREVVGAIDLQGLVTDRDKFSDEIQSKAAKDMERLGLKVISCNIQSITDENKLIEGLGADNTAAIRKNAAITKANADMEISVAQSEANKKANDARVKAETEIAVRNNELSIKQSELKQISDTKKAEADAAYEIQKQEQLKTVNVKTVDAQIEQTKREQVLSQERIKIKQNELTAEINAQSDANKYQTEINAQAELEQKKREAEARAYLAEKEAEATKAKADAAKYAAMQEADGIKAKGEAEAEATKAKLMAEAAGIEAKGIAEAQAMEKKAEAYEKYGQVAVIDMLTKMNEKVLPEVAKSIAEPISKIGNMTVYGTNGSEASGISNNVPIVMKQTFDVVKDATGFDMTDIMKANGIEGKINRNINLNGDDAQPVVQINS
ncbi:MAG: flotillin family protein [Clostridia bacterium]|nr:flotillin family protein [Clostridia bacterium]